jgi:hypothetical protein
MAFSELSNGSVLLDSAYIEGASTAHTKVALGCCYGNVHPRFFQSVVQILGSGEKRLSAAMAVEGLYIEENRNNLVQQFFASGCEWLWMLDSDIAFNPNTLDRLLQATDNGARKIVTAAYWAQHESGNITTWLRMGSGHLSPYLSLPESGMMRLGACGMGCCLIHHDVFEAIRYMRRDNLDPWIWYGRDLIELNGVAKRAGEDVTFCIRAQRAGYSIWGLTDLVVDHYKSQPVRIPKLVLPIQHEEMT